MISEISKFSNTQAQREVDCPKCKQSIGKDCRMPSGRKSREIHWQRGKAYIDSIGKDEFMRRHSIPSSSPPDLSNISNITIMF